MKTNNASESNELSAGGGTTDKGDISGTTNAGTGGGGTGQGTTGTGSSGGTERGGAGSGGGTSTGGGTGGSSGDGTSGGGGAGGRSAFGRALPGSVGRASRQSSGHLGTRLSRRAGQTFGGTHLLSSPLAPLEFDGLGLS
jgi:hypothetical protein